MKAEIWRYDDPGHKDDKTWSFQIIRMPWNIYLQNEDRQGNILDIPESDVSYATWNDACNAARDVLTRG